MTEQTQDAGRQPSVTGSDATLNRRLRAPVIASLLWAFLLSANVTNALFSIAIASSMHHQIDAEESQGALIFQNLEKAQYFNQRALETSTDKYSLNDVKKYCMIALFVMTATFCLWRTRTGSEVFVRLRWVFAVIGLVIVPLVSHSWSDLQEFKYLSPFSIDDTDNTLGMFLYVGLFAATFYVSRRQRVKL